MLGLLAAIVMAVYLVSAWQGQPADLQALAAAFFSALVANQAAFLITPPRHE
jgi:hypothetical protein